ncbi:transcription factor PCL1-like [Henckelia pumila]|uniref:transcription factor PCL1-like n=1 Tax=Henckelia pumila TaxID=405737 RepID=UPI003C6E33A1
MDDRMRIHGVAEWETGLPSVDQLASLSLSLIPPDLASAFRILPEPMRTSGDVHRASHSTLASLRDGKPAGDCEGYQQEGSDPKKSRLMDPIDGETAGGVCLEAAVKKSRLVWTPQLHKRFVEVVTHLGLKNAMPKTIMQLMNVEGLTRENVASHLQKYRLYIKRMQGGWSNEGPSPSDHLFASNEATSNGGTGNIGSENRLRNSIGESGNHEASNDRVPIQMPYPLPPHFTAVPAENGNSGYHGIQQQHNAMMMMQQHNNMMVMMQQQQQRDWPGNMYYHAMNQNQK